MSLEIKWNRSQWWYARYERNGRRISLRLDVRIEGAPPASQKLADRGDHAFETSRAKAQLRSEQVLHELDSAQSEELLLQRIHAARTGRRRLPKVSLAEGHDRWEQIPRKRKLAENVKIQMKSLWLRWSAHVQSKQPAAHHLSDVSPETAASFMSAEEARGVTSKTYNNVLIALRGVFNKLAEQATILGNPFGKIPEKDDNTRIGRIPFSVEELAAILKAAESPEHALVRSVVKVGVSTGMRLGDCCQLQWASVDLDSGFVRVKTNKTGETAEIPLFPLLHQAVRKALPQRGPFVFPEVEAMYADNPDGVHYRVQRLFAEAGFFDAKASSDTSGHRGNIHQERENGLRRANVRGFQSFRVTWVTLALNAGVPVHLVQRVTSHKTVEIVETRYYKPQREHFRRALQDKLPHLSTLAGVPVADPVQQLVGRFKVELEALSFEQRRRLRSEIMGVIDGHPGVVVKESAA